MRMTGKHLGCNINVALRMSVSFCLAQVGSVFFFCLKVWRHHLHTGFNEFIIKSWGSAWKEKYFHAQLLLFNLITSQGKDVIIFHVLSFLWAENLHLLAFNNSLKHIMNTWSAAPFSSTGLDPWVEELIVSCFQKIGIDSGLKYMLLLTSPWQRFLSSNRAICGFYAHCN